MILPFLNFGYFHRFLCDHAGIIIHGIKAEKLKVFGKGRNQQPEYLVKEAVPLNITGDFLSFGVQQTSDRIDKQTISTYGKEFFWK